MEFDEINRKRVKELTKSQLKCTGENIKKLRQKNRLTQMDLAFYIFADKSYISSLERAAVNNVTLSTLIKIAEVFHVSINELINNCV